MDSEEITAYFLYKNKKYPFNLTILRDVCKHSSKYEKIKKNDVIDLIDEFDSFQDLTEDSIISFTNFISNKNFIINDDSNVIEINYLANKYEIESLIIITDIKENPKKIIHDFIYSQIERKHIKIVKNQSKEDIISLNNNDDEDSNNNKNEEEENEISNEDEDDNDNDNDNDNYERPKRAPKKVKKISKRSAFYRGTKKKKNKKKKGKKQKQQETEDLDEKEEKEINKKDIKDHEEKNTNDQEKKETKDNENETKDEEFEETNKQIYIPKIYEDIISEQFEEYVSDEDTILSLFPITNIYRILLRYSKKAFKAISNSMQKQQKYELDKSIIDFLFNYVRNYGIDATFLLDIFDFGVEGTEYFIDQYFEQIDYVNTKIIEVRISKNKHFLDKERRKENINTINEIKAHHAESIKALKEELEQKHKLEIDKITSTVDQMIYQHHVEINELKEKIKLLEQKGFERDLILCANSGSIQIPKEIQAKSFSKIVVPSTIKKIDSKSFINCKYLKEIIIPPSINEIKSRAFEGCSSLTQIEIPSSVKDIGQNAFHQCANLKKITIDLYETKIKEDTFSGCNHLELIVMTSENEKIKAKDFQQIFQNIPSIKIVSFSPKITKILDGSFTGCSTIQQFDIHESIKKLGDNVFKECTSLKKIKIPSSIDEIGAGVFSGCTSLEQVEIPPTVKHIKSHAFHQCSNLNQLTIDLNATKFENDTFNECPRFECIIMSSRTNEVIDMNEFQHIFQRIGTIKKISFSPIITKISANAFKGCNLIQQVVIPSFIKTIGDRAFASCSSINEIQFEAPSQLTSISNFAFYGCLALSQISIPSSVTKISDGAFYECTSLARVELPPTLSIIGQSAFCGCSSLTEIEIPSSVVKILENAFSRCSSLAQITIPTSVNYIGPYNFDNSKTIQEINFPLIVEYFKNSIFIECSSLKKINFMNTDILFDKMINFNDYKITKQIKSNNSILAKIIEVKEERTDKKFVFKVIIPEIEKEKLDSNDILNIMNELNSIPKINGILDIVGYRFPLNDTDFTVIYESFRYPLNLFNDYFQYFIIVTEFMKNNLEEQMKKYLNSQNKAAETINPTIRSKLIFGVASIMKKLHELNICNIDLSNGNIYFDDNLEPKISIFSINRYFSKHSQNGDRYCNLDYLAPECHQNFDAYEKSSDVYGFAIFVYKMFSKELLLPNDFNSSQININQNRPRKPENIPNNYWNLINECWKNNKNERPTFEQIVNNLRKDEFAIKEFGLKTNLDQLHEYQNRINQ